MSDDDKRLAYYQLTLVDGLGPVRIRNLLARFGSARSVLDADLARLEEVDGIGPLTAQAIKSTFLESEAKEKWLRLERLGVRLILESDADYPQSLAEIPAAPPCFTLRGDLLDCDRRAVAIVGSRRSTRYGIQMAERIAGGLAARGVTVVSGLARGIDGAAHRAALKAGGRTIAVLASGLANIYPPEHLELADDVARRGALISEAPLDGPPIGGLFPQRNRIISGLSLGVVVVEAALRSGALSTARHALDQNREVFAVPGRVGDPASEGTNQLLKDGAGMARDAHDVLEQLANLLKDVPPPMVNSAAAQSVALPTMNEKERTIWEAIGSDGSALDLIVDKTGLRASEAASTLLLMEMKKIARRLPGNRFERVG